MSPRRGPLWLGELQGRFGSMLRAPLDRGTGTLRAVPSAYDAVLRDEATAGPWGAADERLAVYNRQYWFRLFSVMQAAHPLATAIAGPWFFNELAARFLVACPPTSWDIDRVPQGFAPFLEALPAEAGPPVPEPQALREAAQIDAAWREVFQAPEVAPFRPSARDAARLLGGRLIASSAVALVVEGWPLLALRRSLPDSPGEAPVALPPRLDRPRWWALARRPGGILQVALEPLEAELLGLLRLYPVGEALAVVEARCPEAERPALPGRAQAWLARSVELGAWAGLE